MRNKYSIGKVSVGKSNTRQNNTKIADDNFTLSEKLSLCSMGLAFAASFIKHELSSNICLVLALIIFFIAAILNFTTLSPITKWRQSSFVIGAIAGTWTAVPLIQYFTKENQSPMMLYISASSVIMWALFSFCVYKWFNYAKAAQISPTNSKRKGAIRFFGWGNKGHKLFVPDVENGRLEWADFTLVLAFMILTGAEKISFIPDFPYKMEIISFCAITLVIGSYFSYYYKLCPASRWGRSSWAVGLTAAALTVVPMILYFTGINENWEKMWHLSAWSSVLWVVFIICRFNLYRVRKRAKAEIAMIEWRSRNKKKDY